jgi:hypothetical protein
LMHINSDRRTGLAQMRGPFAIQSVLAVQSDRFFKHRMAFRRSG